MKIEIQIRKTTVTIQRQWKTCFVHACRSISFLNNTKLDIIFLNFIFATRYRFYVVMHVSSNIERTGQYCVLYASDTSKRSKIRLNVPVLRGYKIEKTIRNTSGRTLFDVTEIRTRFGNKRSWNSRRNSDVFLFWDAIGSQGQS